MDSRVSRHNARFRSTDNLLSGDWFASRTVQGHVIAAVQPTRARVEFGEDGGVPVAISSMGSTLTELFYRDARGGYWRVQDLNTGERKRMQKADAKAFDAWRSNAAKSFGARLRKTFPDDRNATDFFYATASGTTEQCIPTLPAVNWTQEGLIYFGPATRAGATATGDRT